MKKQLLLFSLFAINVLVAQVPTYVPTTGLVGYWPFNGNANDESGNGNNGIINGASLTTDRFGNNAKSYLFNGIDNYIEVVSNTQLSVTNSYSISAWFNANLWYNTSTSDRSILSKIQSTGWYGGYEIMIGGNTGDIIHTGNIAGSNFLIGNSGYSTNNWYLCTITFDSNNLKLYMNGILVSTIIRPGSIQSSNQSLFFGRRDGCCQWFSGKIDDIGIWNRALTQEEINGLYNASSANECQTLVINTGILSFNPVTYTNTVTIYPNPANDHITIDCGNLANVAGWNIKITNALGQEVFSGAMNTPEYVVPLNSWGGQGLYFVRIYDAQNNLVNTKKIILQ